MPRRRLRTVVHRRTERSRAAPALVEAHSDGTGEAFGSAKPRKEAPSLSFADLALNRFELLFQLAALLAERACDLLRVELGALHARRRELDLAEATGHFPTAPACREPPHGVRACSDGSEP